jgi:uncharacterized protein (TIGR02145 family)
MKNHILSALAILLITNYFVRTPCMAQAPQGIPYQAIARNASGVAIANTAVKVRFSIRDSIATGAIKYQEAHNPTTSALGLFSVNVGMGTVVSGTFSGINWGKNSKFLQVEMDPAGGSSYTDIGTTQMMSVPYALYAGEMPIRISNSGDTLFIGNQKIQVSGISRSKNIGPELIDIDGNVYQSIKIGNQTWMRDNLKVSKYRNGDNIASGLTNSQWGTTTSGAVTAYDNNGSISTFYGNLYNWYAVSDSRGLCPTGWHVPSQSEFSELISFLGGAAIAGGKIKSESSTWASPNIAASNSSGFSSLAAGTRPQNGSYTSLGSFTAYWSITPTLSNDAFGIFLNSQSINVATGYDIRYSGYSVRCLKD